MFKFEQKEGIDNTGGLEKLKNLEKEIAAKLNEEGVPVDDNCRIKTDAFGSIYTTEDIVKDQKTAVEEESEEERIKKDGEQLEILKTIIFNKFLGNDFIVARASFYDDTKNKIDNIILDKKTGNLVCALDEVAAISGKEFEEKKEKVLARNMKEGGGRLKYGLLMKNGKLGLGPVDHFPLFYLALPPDRIKKAINKLGPSLNEKTDYENKLFSYFLSLIDSQIKALKLYSRFDDVLRRSIELFEKSLKNLRK